MRKITDTHVHIGESEKCSLSYGIEEYRSLMADLNIDSAFVMPNITSQRSLSSVNEKFIKQFPQKDMYPIILIDPKNKKTRKQANDYDIKGLKYHGSLCQRRVDDPSLSIFWQIAYERGLFCIVHCGRSELSRIEPLIDVACKWPVTFIGAHLGGGATDIVESALENKFPDNLYLDISACKVPRLIEMAVRKIGAEKILFGSDIPYADFRITEYCLWIADISDEEKELIYHKNSERILNEAGNSLRPEMP